MVKGESLLFEYLLTHRILNPEKKPKKKKHPSVEQKKLR